MRSYELHRLPSEKLGAMFLAHFVAERLLFATAGLLGILLSFLSKFILENTAQRDDAKTASL